MVDKNICKVPPMYQTRLSTAGQQAHQDCIENSGATYFSVQVFFFDKILQTRPSHNILPLYLFSDIFYIGKTYFLKSVFGKIEFIQFQSAEQRFGKQRNFKQNICLIHIIIFYSYNPHSFQIISDRYRLVITDR